MLIENFNKFQYYSKTNQLLEVNEFVTKLRVATPTNDLAKILVDGEVYIDGIDFHLFYAGAIQSLSKYLIFFSDDLPKEGFIAVSRNTMMEQLKSDQSVFLLEFLSTKELLLNNITQTTEKNTPILKVNKTHFESLIIMYDQAYDRLLEGLKIQSSNKVNY